MKCSFSEKAKADIFLKTLQTLCSDDDFKDGIKIFFNKDGVSVKEVGFSRSIMVDLNYSKQLFDISPTEEVVIKVLSSYLSGGIAVAEKFFDFSKEIEIIFENGELIFKTIKPLNQFAMGVVKDLEKPKINHPNPTIVLKDIELKELISALFIIGKVSDDDITITLTISENNLKLFAKDGGKNMEKNIFCKCSQKIPIQTRISKRSLQFIVNMSQLSDSIDFYTVENGVLRANIKFPHNTIADIYIASSVSPST